MARRDAFPPDRNLEVRMAAAVVLQTLIVGGALVGLILVAILIEDGWVIPIIAVGFLAAGATAGLAPTRGGERMEPAHGRISPIVTRLSAVAGIKPPAVRIMPAWDAALSWTTVAPLKGARITVTNGLLRRLDDQELEVVLAHEIGHLINRDAAVMTALLGPPMTMLRGLRAGWEKQGRWAWPKILTVLYGIYFFPVAAAGMLVGRLLGRQRELAADRAAALLTGSPARVEAVLLKVSGALAQIPSRDLRVVALGDPFHFVPARPAQGLARLWATHPTVEARVERLARMEVALQR